MIDSVVGLVEEHVDLGWFSIFCINSRTLARAAIASQYFVVVLELLKSMSSSILFTNCLIVGVERLDLMIYFRVCLVMQRCVCQVALIYHEFAQL